MTITRDAAVQLLRSQTNSIFSVTFIKANGDVREMNCRLRVKKHWKTPDGSGGKYKPADYDLLCVFDMQKTAYRTINLKTLQSMVVQGQQYTIKD